MSNQPLIVDLAILIEPIKSIIKNPDTKVSTNSILNLTSCTSTVLDNPNKTEGKKTEDKPTRKKKKNE